MIVDLSLLCFVLSTASALEFVAGHEAFESDEEQLNLIAGLIDRRRLLKFNSETSFTQQLPSKEDFNRKVKQSSSQGRH